MSIITINRAHQASRDTAPDQPRRLRQAEITDHALQLSNASRDGTTPRAREMALQAALALWAQPNV